MKNEPLIIKKRGDDGNKLSAETNHSRNELINLILAHGVENIEIQ